VNLKLIPMKTLLRFFRFSLAISVCLLLAAAPCFGARSIGVVTKEEAKKMGIEIETRPSGADAVWIQLKFKRAEVNSYSHVDLEVWDGKLGVSSALKEWPSDPSEVVVNFRIARANLPKAMLVIVGGPGNSVGHQVLLKDYAVVIEEGGKAGEKATPAVK
jgi:hypothetical protein